MHLLGPHKLHICKSDTLCEAGNIQCNVKQNVYVEFLHIEGHFNW